MDGNDKEPEHLDKYDLCLVFPLDQKSDSMSSLRAEVAEKIVDLVGREYVYLFRDRTRRKMVMYIRASLRMIKKRAETDKLQLLLNADKAKLIAYEGNDDASIDGFEIPHMEEATYLEPFDFIYGNYLARRDVQHLYHCSSGMNHPFRKSIRVKLLSSILQSSNSITCELSLEHLRLGRTIDCYYPVHDEKELRAFASDWVGCWLPPWTQPFEEIKDYFGEKLGFYFIFLGFISYWLVAPMLIGVGLQVLMILYEHKGNPESPCFAGLSALWVCTAVRYWSKVEQVTAMKWNMTGIADKSTRCSDCGPARYSFHGRAIQSYIDGGYMLYFNGSRRRCFYVFSVVCCLMLLLICLTTVAALFYLRSIIRTGYIAGISLDGYEDWLTGATCSLQISVANQLIYMVSVGLSDMENHRSDAHYDCSLVFKIATLQSINAFSSFLYIAFGAAQTPHTYPSAALSAVPLQESVDGCGRFSECFATLQVHVLVVLATQAVGATMVNGLLPMLIEYAHKELLPILCDCCYTCFCAAPDRSRDTSYDTIECDVCLYNPFAYNACACCACCDEESMTARDRGDSIELGEAYRRRGSMDDFTGVNPTGRSRLTPEEPQKTVVMSDRMRTDSNLQSFDNDDDDDDDEDDEQDEAYSVDDHNLAVLPTQSRKAASPSMPPMNRDMDMGSTAESKFDAMSTDRYSPTFQPRNARRIGLPSDGGMDENDSVVVDDDAAVSSQPGRTPPPGDASDDLDMQGFDSSTRRGHYDQDHRLRCNYARVTLMLHIATCFGSALPGSFVIVFLYVYFEIKSSARKLSFVTHRPFPVEEEGIMAWKHVLHAFVYVSVVTNAALIAFSMQQFVEWQLQYRLCLFIAVVVLCSVYRSALWLAMKEVPSEVTIQQLRSRFINSKLITPPPDTTSHRRALDLL